MIGFSSHIRRRRPGILPGLGVAVGVALMAFQCLAEDARPESPPPSAEPRATEAFRPGFVEAFGRLLEDSAAKLNSQLNQAHQALGEIGNQTGDAAKGAMDSAKGAADTIIGLPSARIVTSRQVCTAAANGAPDCRSAADTMCRAKGFASGKSLDTQTTQKCPAWVWLSGRPPADGDCTRETSVTRAVCQ
jgi:hypothetical protein